ncbi:MAG: hypothetical protein JWO13_2587 [Acidobacteriales bacterium]|nr:hypothetical protein [Terriglobales bacterium]
MIIRTITCSGGCGEQIVLPHGTRPGVSEVRWYWPEDSKLLHFAHIKCGHLSSHTRPNGHNEFQIVDEEAPDVFWEVIFECDQESCDQQILIHTTSPRSVKRSQIEAWVRKIATAVKCDKGHLFSAASPLVSIQVIDFR